MTSKKQKPENMPSAEKVQAELSKVESRDAIEQMVEARRCKTKREKRLAKINRAGIGLLPAD